MCVSGAAAAGIYFFFFPLPLSLSLFFFLFIYSPPPLPANPLLPPSSLPASPPPLPQQRRRRRLPIRARGSARRLQSGSWRRPPPSPPPLPLSRLLIMPLCLCVSAGRLTMISSVITYRASPCGLGAPSGAILMALGALLPFSIIMWTTGATAQSKTLQVCDEEGAHSTLLLLLLPLPALLLSPPSQP